MNRIEFNSLVRALETEIHADNVKVGWWTDKDTGEDLLETRNRPEMLMLFVSEVTEADDGHVGGLNDDKLPHLPMVDVEIADVAIRAFDTIGAENRRYGNTIDYDYYEKLLTHAAEMDRKFDKITAERLFLNVVNQCSRALEHLRKGRTIEYRTALSDVLTACFIFAAFYDSDIFDVIRQKREFNATRADHKLENRRQEGGKAF